VEKTKQNLKDYLFDRLTVYYVLKEPVVVRMNKKLIEKRKRLTFLVNYGCFQFDSGLFPFIYPHRVTNGRCPKL
jgi:hypothetical protein